MTPIFISIDNYECPVCGSTEIYQNGKKHVYICGQCETVFHEYQVHEQRNDEVKGDSQDE